MEQRLGIHSLRYLFLMRVRNQKIAIESNPKIYPSGLSKWLHTQLSMFPGNGLDNAKSSNCTLSVIDFITEHLFLKVSLPNPIWVG